MISKIQQQDGHIKSLQSKLSKLATEAEQLRKERDEFAKSLILVTNLYDENFWNDDVQKSIKKAKRIIENETLNTANKPQ